MNENKSTVSFDQFTDFPSIADQGITSKVVFSNKAYKNLLRLINESIVNGEMSRERGCIFIGKSIRNKFNESIILIDDYTCDFETVDGFVEDGSVDHDKAFNDLNNKNLVGSYLFHFHTHPKVLHYESFSDQDLFSYLEFANQKASINNGLFVSGMLATPNRSSNRLFDNIQLSMIFCVPSYSYVSDDMDDYDKFLETAHNCFLRWPSICYIDDKSNIVSFGEYMRHEAPHLTLKKEVKKDALVTAFGVDPNTGLQIPTKIVGHFVNEDDFSIISYGNSIFEKDGLLYDENLNNEIFDLLQNLKDFSYSRKERSKFVVRVEQIIEIYRNEIHNDKFADNLVRVFNNAQKKYEEGIKKVESVSLPTNRVGKHFKAVHLETEKSISMSDDLESKIEDEAQKRVQIIDDNVYKTSSQKVDEMLDKKMAEINKRVDGGETLDSKIDDLSRYVIDLNNRRDEIKKQFKEAWVSSDVDEFDKLLEEDNNLKNLISDKKAEIERRSYIRDIVDEQIKREEAIINMEKNDDDVNLVNNSNLSDEQKRILIDGIYAEFGKEEHSKEKGRSR